MSDRKDRRANGRRKVMALLGLLAATGLISCSRVAARGDATPNLKKFIPGYGLHTKSGPSVDNDVRTRANDDGTAKIVGGTPVANGVFNDVVGIVRSGSTIIQCTGTLIEPDIVLTAGHCACAGIDSRIFVGNKVSSGGAFYDVARVVHGLPTIQTASGIQCVTPLPLKDSRDLAVLRLTRPVVGVAPRPLADDHLVDRAMSFHVVGFGAIDRDASVYPHEKDEAVVVATSNNCRGNPPGGSDETVYGCKPEDEIVAGALGEAQDTCNGDSGGPLLISSNRTGRALSVSDYRLAGVTSRASSLSDTYCGDGGIYERLNASGREWVRNAVLTARNQP